MQIDHTTLRTHSLEETKEFLIKVFDVTEGTRPSTIASRIKGYWLFHKDAPLIHLIESSPYAHPGLDHSAEAIDHTGFLMENYHIFKQKLNTLNVPYSLMDLPEIGERRIFIHTPTGILLETVFREKVAD
jgi:catechol 2,3-dioxygenase-like lactoylglutathione lyase family enzyme